MEGEPFGRQGNVCPWGLRSTSRGRKQGAAALDTAGAQLGRGNVKKDATINRRLTFNVDVDVDMLINSGDISVTSVLAWAGRHD